MKGRAGLSGDLKQGSGGPGCDGYLRDHVGLGTSRQPPSPDLILHWEMKSPDNQSIVTAAIKSRISEEDPLISKGDGRSGFISFCEGIAPGASG